MINDALIAQTTKVDQDAMARIREKVDHAPDSLLTKNLSQLDKYSQPNRDPIEVDLKDGSPASATKALGKATVARAQRGQKMPSEVYATV